MLSSAFDLIYSERKIACGTRIISRRRARFAFLSKTPHLSTANLSGWLGGVSLTQRIKLGWPLISAGAATRRFQIGNQAPLLLHAVVFLHRVVFLHIVRLHFALLVLRFGL